MLIVKKEKLPDNILTYLAFRVSFLETLEQVALARHSNRRLDEQFGYLTEVPFLSAVPGHVQLDLLAETWRKHHAHRKCFATLVDESVIYAVCETAAHIAEDSPQFVERCMATGPRACRFVVDEYLPEALRMLHLNLPIEGDFLLVSQFEDMPPDQARRLRRQLDIDERRLDELFQVLGRWRMSRRFLKNLKGLFTDSEIARTGAILGLQPIEQ